MKREEVKTILPSITDEQLQQLMDLHGKDITAEKQKVTTLTGERDTLQTQLTEATNALKAFEGVDVADLNGQIAALTQKLSDQAADFAFDRKLSEAMRKHGAKSEKAARALLDVDALKASKNQDADIEAAFAALRQSDGYLFGSEQRGAHVDLGGSHGQSGDGGEEDGVTRAFKALNPTIQFS